MMIDERIGIRMCQHKRIRREYGTITYQETKIVLPDPKAQYDEIHALIKKEKKKQRKHKIESKKIDIKQKTDKERIQDLVDISVDPNIENLEKELTDNPEFSFMDEPIERLSGEGKKEETEQETEKETEQEKEQEKEQETEQEGGLLTKRIYVTDLSVDKDKEMFQM